MYTYKAKLQRVVDGDTIDATIDLGFDVFVKKRIRFAGINAPESRTRDLEEKARGLKAKDRVKNILKNVTIEKAPTGTPSGTQMTVKRRNKANKIAKILYERGDISSPNYADIKFESKDYYKINARMNRKIIKKKDGTLDFKDESKKPLRSDQQAKLKKRFPEADFSKGKYGFPVDSAEEQYAKRYFKQGNTDSINTRLI